MIRACGIVIRDRETTEPLFDLLLYGVELARLTAVVAEPPVTLRQRLRAVEAMSGGRLVRAALRRRGLNPDDFLVSVFDAYEVRGGSREVDVNLLGEPVHEYPSAERARRARG